MTTPKAAVIMGSDSDFEALKPCIKRLRAFGIETEVRVISAHRTPDAAAEFAKSAKENGFSVIIAAAGKAAHLAGVIASFTTLPVIGIPMKSSTLDGLDSLLSVVQMPPGIPVATVAVDGAENAAILAAQMLSLRFDGIGEKLEAFKHELVEKTRQKDARIIEEAKNI